jgi:acyl carrier protein
MSIASQATKSIKAVPQQYDFDGICVWLRTEIAKVFKTETQAIDIRASVAELGLDSMSVVMLVGNLEELLQLELEPSLIYEYDSLESFCQQLAIMHQKQIQKQQAANKTQMTVNVVASFTAEPVEESLSYWLETANFT